MRDVCLLKESHQKIGEILDSVLKKGGVRKS